MKRKFILIFGISAFITINLALVYSFISIINYIDFKKSEIAFQVENLKDRVVDSCLEKSIVKTPEKEEPILYIYDICMKDKGAQTVYSYAGN